MVVPLSRMTDERSEVQMTVGNKVVGIKSRFFLENKIGCCWTSAEEI